MGAPSPHENIMLFLQWCPRMPKAEVAWERQVGFPQPFLCHFILALTEAGRLLPVQSPGTAAAGAGAGLPLPRLDVIHFSSTGKWLSEAFDICCSLPRLQCWHGLLDYWSWHGFKKGLQYFIVPVLAF